MRIPCRACIRYHVTMTALNAYKCVCLLRGKSRNRKGRRQGRYSPEIPCLPREGEHVCDRMRPLSRTVVLSDWFWLDAWLVIEYPLEACHSDFGYYTKVLCTRILRDFPQIIKLFAHIYKKVSKIDHNNSDFECKKRGNLTKKGLNGVLFQERGVEKIIKNHN